MIRTNLATRPFYNERTVRTILLLVAIAVVAFTAFNASRVLRYSRSDTRLQTQAARDEARAAELRRQAVALRATVNPKQIEKASGDAATANDLIDRRTFSWTDLFNRFETTLPDDVRITQVRPRIEKQGFTLTINVVARSIDDVNTFMENLEETGAFMNTISREERFDESQAATGGGAPQLNAAIETTYLPEVGHAGGSTIGRGRGARR